MKRSIILFTALLLCASFAWAQDLKPFQTGKLLQMEPVPCHASEKTQEPRCQVYWLEADSVVFHIRPKSARNAPLLPVGERAQFRIANGNILLHMDGIDSQEREYIVVSMSPRTESDSADASPARVNHLQ
jgi:hypothetical protein